MSSKILTSVHYFDFHRNQRHLYFSMKETLTVGPYPELDIVLPTPSLYKGLLCINPSHQVTAFSTHQAFRNHKHNQSKNLSPEDDTFSLEEKGVMVTLRRSWQPFQSLIDNLIELTGLKPELKHELQIRDWIEKLIPKDILAIWSIQKIWDAYNQHRSGYGDIEGLINNPSVTEILINGCESTYYETDGHLHPLHQKMTPTRLDRLITKLVQKSGRTVNTKKPMVDLQLPTGERVNIILPPVSKKGPLISIRKFKHDLISLEMLQKKQTFDTHVASHLQKLIQEKKNILISGGTGSGKTTLLNALLSECDSSERIIIVEDSSELHPKHPHWLNLETRPPNQDSEAEVSMSALIKNTLRMRPSRVICGECRGPEAFQMLLAMNSGHPGSITTIHANTPKEALIRLEIFLLMAGFDVPHRAIRQFISSSIDVICQMNREVDGSRRLCAIMQLNKTENQDGYVMTNIL